MKYSFISFVILTFLALHCLAQENHSFIYPGRIWKDQANGRSPMGAGYSILMAHTIGLVK
jgi:hypothetical protein